MSRGPVFIGGLDRSGKTYMRLMLAAHPAFAVSKRTNLWPRFYNKFGDLARDADLVRCLEALADHKHIRSLGIDFQRLRRDFGSGSRSYERLFALVHEQYAARLGKPRWGDQTELLEKYATEILAAYPEATFIHMLRDPRDRYEAVLDKAHHRGGVGAATARWLYSAALAERHQKSFPLRYIVVRYETMVSQPAETMLDICHFLGEAFHPAMVEMRDVPRFANHQGNPLSTDYIGRFRDRLPAHEVAFIQKHAARYMFQFGYAIENIRFSMKDSVQFYAFHWSLNLAQMLGWRMRNRAAG